MTGTGGRRHLLWVGRDDAIQIKQTFPRCQLCGKIIPPRAALVELARSGQPAVRFCSVWCRDEFADRLTRPTQFEAAAAR